MASVVRSEIFEMYKVSFFGSNKIFRFPPLYEEMRDDYISV